MLHRATLSLVILLAMPLAASAQVLKPAGEPRLPLYRVGPEKNPALAWALSAAFPGLGQFYNGQPQKGALHLGMTLFFIMTAAEYGGLPEELGFAGLVGTWAWSMIDAPLAAKAINEGRVQVAIVRRPESGRTGGFTGLHGSVEWEVKVSLRVPEI